MQMHTLHLPASCMQVCVRARVHELTCCSAHAPAHSAVWLWGSGSVLGRVSLGQCNAQSVANYIYWPGAGLTIQLPYRINLCVCDFRFVATNM